MNLICTRNEDKSTGNTTFHQNKQHCISAIVSASGKCRAVLWCFHGYVAAGVVAGMWLPWLPA